MQHAFEIQTMTGQYWLEIVAIITERDALKSEVDALKATLTSHQQISDALVARAKELYAAGDMAALAAVIEDASLYPAEREAARLAAEAAEIEAQIAELAAKRAALLAPPSDPSDIPTDQP